MDCYVMLDTIVIEFCSKSIRWKHSIKLNIDFSIFKRENKNEKK